MSFFSRPSLIDLQFKQEPGSDSILSLSGQTRFKTWSGLTISDGAGTDILVTASGASSATTEGYVLTYMNGCISLQPSSSSGGTFQFNTHRATTRSGIPVVTVSGACTVNNFLEGYFFPAVAPSSSLSVATGGNSREFGDGTVGRLCYQALRETNQICLVAISSGGTGTYTGFPVTTAIAGDCCNTSPYIIPNPSCYNPSSGTSQTSVSYSVCVQSTVPETSISSASITWRNKKFRFKSNILYIDDSITAALSGGVLSTSKALTLNDEIFNNDFFYYVYPTSFGTPSFKVNGLPNNAWGNAGSGTLFKINYTNVNGYLNQYYVARSDSRITGTYNIEIT